MIGGQAKGSRGGKRESNGGIEKDEGKRAGAEQGRGRNWMALFCRA